MCFYAIFSWKWYFLYNITIGCKFQHCSVNTFGDMALQSWLKRQFSKLPKNASIFKTPYLGKYLTDCAENQNTVVFLVEDEA